MLQGLLVFSCSFLISRFPKLPCRSPHMSNPHCDSPAIGISAPWTCSWMFPWMCRWMFLLHASTCWTVCLHIVGLLYSNQHRPGMLRVFTCTLPPRNLSCCCSCCCCCCFGVHLCAAVLLPGYYAGSFNADGSIASTLVCPQGFFCSGGNVTAAPTSNSTQAAGAGATACPFGAWTQTYGASALEECCE